jgi:methionine synthase II (cobalamin-independent)
LKTRGMSPIFSAMKIKGLATGIGSLPHKDARQALELIFKYLPAIPFWPQLPKKDIREGMVAQFSENLPGLKVTGDGLFFDNHDIDAELEVFYDRIISGDIDHFKISRNFAEGLYSFHQSLKSRDLKEVEFIKCHITGPFTFSAGLNNREGVALLHDQVFMQVITKGLAMKAQWQAKFFREFGKKLIVFIDEPYLACFGSAFTPVTRETVVLRLNELTQALSSDDTLIGIHCCGNTDWSMFTDVAGIDIISFDAFSFTDKLVLYAGDLNNFFKRGGKLCWGVVPSQDIPVFPGVESLLARIEDGIGALIKKGVDQDLARNNLLLSPSCGLGTTDEAKASRVFSSLSEISSVLRSS